MAVEKKQIQKEKPKKRLIIHHHKWKKEDYEKVIRYYCSGYFISIADVSKLVGMPYNTVKTIVRDFRIGKITLGANPKKPGPNFILV